MTNRLWDMFAFLNLRKASEAGSDKRKRQWQDILTGLKLGELDVGSRTPVSGMPAWATPEVARGGFATGGYAAGGPPLAHEIELAQAKGIGAAQQRHDLNLWHISDDGLAYLRALADTRCFRADTPEETALLCVAQVIAADPDRAAAILAEITPFFDRLRFFPKPANAPRPEGVHLRDVGALIEGLLAKKPANQIVVQHQTLHTWIPLYDRLVDLLTADRDATWQADAHAWLVDYAKQDAPEARRWRDPEGPFQRCRAALVTLCDGQELSPRDARYVALVAKRRAAKYGSGADRATYRAAQKQQDVTLLHDAVGQIVAERFGDSDLDGGLPDPSAYATPMTDAEAPKLAGEAIPQTFVAKMEKTRTGTVPDLVSEGVISSPEVLAMVLPQLTADVQTQGFQTTGQASVYREFYLAFRRRRSLLLLNYASQVKPEELPWAAGLLEFRKGGAAPQKSARDTLALLITLTLTHFPHVQFPNKLITEILQLTNAAGLKTPITREIAADIFMGDFTANFAQAASIAIDRYANTPYGFYYDMPTSLPRGGFGAYCTRRAGITQGGNWSVARNGQILEQQLVMTTHNLAALFETFPDADLPFDQMALNCFTWLCDQHAKPQHNWRAGLHMTKNTAYAWRQMLAFLSELNADEQGATAALITDHFATQPTPFRDRFAPAMAGLSKALAGQRADPDAGEVFYGWASGKHPFAPPSK